MPKDQDNWMPRKSVCLPPRYIQDIDWLVAQGRYRSPSDVIRIAIRDLLKDEVWNGKEV